MDSLSSIRSHKDKVVFILGATGSGKSKLSITLAKHFHGEVINSDKMQIYDGLEVITNKVTDEECDGVPHHLLGGVHPEADFTAADFRREAMKAVESVIGRGRVPIVAGGSNSYIEELVEGNGGEFRARYDCYFLWVDVDMAVHQDFVAERVDKMVERGLVEEARRLFQISDVDYTRGIRRSIGVPELDEYFRLEAAEVADEQTKARVLAAAIDMIKLNTCKLIYCQLLKIQRFCTMNWGVRRIDATKFFLNRRQERVDIHEEKLWDQEVGGPSIAMVGSFLSGLGAQQMGDQVFKEEEMNHVASLLMEIKNTGRMETYDKKDAATMVVVAASENGAKNMVAAGDEIVSCVDGKMAPESASLVSNAIQVAVLE